MTCDGDYNYFYSFLIIVGNTWMVVSAESAFTSPHGDWLVAGQFLMECWGRQ